MCVSCLAWTNCFGEWITQSHLVIWFVKGLRCIDLVRQHNIVSNGKRCCAKCKLGSRISSGWQNESSSGGSLPEDRFMCRYSNYRCSTISRVGMLYWTLFNSFMTKTVLNSFIVSLNILSNMATHDWRENLNSEGCLTTWHFIFIVFLLLKY